MARYVDGFVLAIPKRNKAKYLKLARLGRKVWLEHGAIDYCECIADDVPYGKRTSFPRSVKVKPGETVWFAFIVFKSRKHRDAVNARAIRDKRFAKMDPKKMPFDPRRMIYGGFKSLVG